LKASCLTNPKYSPQIITRYNFGMQNIALKQRLFYRKKRNKFTGKEQDPETGLYYYGARYLDPKTSRWLSGDPAMGEYFPVAPVSDEAKKHNEELPNGGVYNYISLHSYNYSNNNPVKYSDPDGKIPFMLVTGIIGGIAGAGISIAADVAAGRDINWCRAGLAAGAGALAGFTLGATAAAAATATPLVAGNAAASFSTVAGYVSGTTATVAATATGSALPLGTEISKQYSNTLTSSQLSNVKTISEISHNLRVRNTLSGTILDPGHIEKIKNNIQGLRKALTSIEGSLQNRNLTQEARDILITAQEEAISLIQRGTELLETIK